MWINLDLHQSIIDRRLLTRSKETKVMLLYNLVNECYLHQMLRFCLLSGNIRWTRVNLFPSQPTDCEYLVGQYYL